MLHWNLLICSLLILSIVARDNDLGSTKVVQNSDEYLWRSLEDKGGGKYEVEEGSDNRESGRLREKTQPLQKSQRRKQSSPTIQPAVTGSVQSDIGVQSVFSGNYIRNRRSDRPTFKRLFRPLPRIFRPKNDNTATIPPSTSPTTSPTPSPTRPPTLNPTTSLTPNPTKSPTLNSTKSATQNPNGPPTPNPTTPPTPSPVASTATGEPTVTDMTWISTEKVKYAPYEAILVKWFRGIPQLGDFITVSTASANPMFYKVVRTVKLCNKESCLAESRDGEKKIISDFTKPGVYFVSFYNADGLELDYVGIEIVKRGIVTQHTPKLFKN